MYVIHKLKAKISKQIYKHIPSTHENETFSGYTYTSLFSFRQTSIGSTLCSAPFQYFEVECSI